MEYINPMEQPESCFQHFSIKMSDDSEPPVRFGEQIITIDEATGVLRIKKDPAALVSYMIDIIVHTTGGIEDEQLILSNVAVGVVCGPDSTRLIPPTLSIKSKAPE